MSKPKFKIGDKVRILDGSEIKGYTGGFVSDMAASVGKVATVCDVSPWPDGRIAYRLEGVKNYGGYFWDERGLQPVAAEKPRKIIVMQDKADPMKVVARDLDTGKVGVAKCSPQDSFDFYTGAKLAFDRLTASEAKTEPEKPKYYNGKVVCVKKSSRAWFWTPGKVYEIKDGVIFDDDCEPRRDIRGVSELNAVLYGAAKFIALVE